jgi:O-acetyl-ADP-ribose deacetylase
VKVEQSITVGNTAIEVAVGDLVEADTEAIVNAANSELWMGGGVAGAIKSAAGSEVEREAMANGSIAVGEALATSAGRLKPPIRWVVHAATMGPDLRTSEDYIRSATASALAVAAEVGAASVALPAMGTGVGGFPMARAARVMTDEAQAAASAGRSPARITFVLRDADAASLFVDALSRYRRDDDRPAE